MPISGDFWAFVCGYFRTDFFATFSTFYWCCFMRDDWVLFYARLDARQLDIDITFFFISRHYSISPVLHARPRHLCWRFQIDASSLSLCTPYTLSLFLIGINSSVFLLYFGSIVVSDKHKMFFCSTFWCWPGPHPW